MATKPVTDPHKAWNIQHHKRLEAYNKRIEKLLNQAISQAVELALRYGATSTKDKPFFYAQNRQLKADTDRLLKDLADEITALTKNGEGKEWEKAYQQATEYLSEVYKVAKQTETLQNMWDERLLAMKVRNLDALKAFEERKIGGLNLSNKVWNYTSDFEKQLEVTIDQALLEGKSADSLSRDIRSLLLDPDKLFRRVRDDDDQLRMSRAMQAFHPGRGKYRSAYMNAKRLAVSEINMAYRASDDNVANTFDACVGIRINLSNNHTCNGKPFVDICDFLQGNYPKDFKFVGWHPFCYDEESEVYTNHGWKYFSEVDDDDLILSLNPETRDLEYVGILYNLFRYHKGKMVHFEGDDIDCLVTPEHNMVCISDKQVDFIPAEDFEQSNGSFTTDKECKCVSDTFSKALTQYDGMVYDLTLERNHIMYIRRNGKCFWGSNCRCYITYILKTDEEFWRDLQDGVNRESVNTVKDVPDAFKEWVAENGERITKWDANGKMPYFLRDNRQWWDEEAMPKQLTIQERAAIRHAARTENEVEAIKKAYWERQSTRNYANRILNYMDGISDVDTSDLRNALKTADLSLILSEAKKLKAVGKEILSYTLLDNPIQVARETSMAMANTINSAVARTISKMPTDLVGQKDKLEFEIGWMEREGSRRYPDTWKYSQAAYKKYLAQVEHELKIQSIKDSVEDALSYATTTRSKAFRGLADEMRGLLSSSTIDTTKAHAKAEELKKKYEQLLKDKRYYARSTGKEEASTGKLKHETVADLKDRLGKKFPKTLTNLEDAISKYESSSYKYGKIAKDHKAEIEKLMREVFEKHDLGMNIEADTLELVLNSWFKNQFESGTSNGALDSTSTTGEIEPYNCRLQAAHKLFGIGDVVKDQLKRKEYEKYGNLLDHDMLRAITNNSASSYGEVQVRFKKDKVVATWTAGDSLSCDFQPSLVSDPRACSFDNLYRTPTSDNIQTDDFVKFRRDHISTYLELQFHGDLTIDCVESITFPNDLSKPYQRHERAIAEKWKAIGVKIYYLSENYEIHQL